MAKLERLRKSQGIQKRKIASDLKKTDPVAPEKPRETVGNFVIGESDTKEEQRLKVGPVAPSTAKKRNLDNALGVDATASNSFDSVSGTTPGGGEVTSSIEDRAGALLAQDQQDLFEVGQEFFGEESPIEPSSLDEKVTDSIQKRKAQELVKKQKEEASFLAEQQAAQEKLDEAQFGRAKDQAKAAIGATEQSFAQGRQGPISSSNPLLSKEFTQEMDKRIGEANTRLQMAKRQREQIKIRLADAQKAGRAQAVEGIRKQLANAENRVREMDTAYINEINQSQQIALDVSYKTSQINNQAFATFEKMPPGGLAEMEIPEISAMMGINEVMAATLKSFDKQRSTLDPSDPNYNLNLAKVNKATNEARWAGMTPEMKNFTHYQDLLKSDPVQAQQFAVQAGIEDIASVQNAGSQANDLWNENKSYYDKNKTWPPTNSKYAFQVNGNQVNWTGLEDGEVASTRWQCGEVVNDALGKPGFFTNTFEEKKARVNSSSPIAGGAFVEKALNKFGNPTQYGHVGLIESVNEDGSFNIVESNYKTNGQGQGIVGRSTISKGSARWNSIVQEGGFFDPSQQKTGQALEIEAVQAQLKSGRLTPKETSEFRDRAKKEGWLNEFTDIITSPKIKPITPAQATNFGVSEGINQFDLDDIIADRQESGGGNRRFQSFTGTDEKEKLVNLKLLGERITEMRDLKKELNDLGGETGPEGFRNFQAGIEKTPILGALIPAQTDELEVFQKLQALSGDLLAQYVKDLSGAAVSEEEFQRLKQNRPNVNQLDSQFDDQLSRMSEDYDKLIQSQMRNFGFDTVEQMNAAISGNPIRSDSAFAPSYTMPTANNNLPV